MNEAILALALVTLAGRLLCLRAAQAPAQPHRRRACPKGSAKAYGCQVVFLLLFSTSLAAEIPEITKSIGQISLRGDFLRTGRNSRAQLKFPDSMLIVRVGSNTVLSGITTPRSMKLLQGVVLFSIKKGAGVGVVKVGTLTARGSNFLASNVLNGANKIICLAGKTSVFATANPRLKTTLLQGQLIVLPPEDETLTRLPRKADIDLDVLMSTSMLGNAGGMGDFPNMGKKSGRGAGGIAADGASAAAAPMTAAETARAVSAAPGALDTPAVGGTAAQVAAPTAPAMSVAASSDSGGEPPLSIGITAVSATAMTTLAIENQRQQIARQQAAIAQAEAARVARLAAQQQQAARIAAQQQQQQQQQQLAAKEAEANRIAQQQRQQQQANQGRGPQGNQGRGPQGNQGQGNQGQGNQGQGNQGQGNQGQGQGNPGVGNQLP